MARALRITVPGAFYHVTSRGNERKAVFKSKRDREKFLEYPESAAQRYDSLIQAYCISASKDLPNGYTEILSWIISAKRDQAPKKGIKNL